MLTQRKHKPPKAAQPMPLAKMREVLIRTIALEFKGVVRSPYQSALWFGGAIFVFQIFCALAGLPRGSKDPRVVEMAEQVVSDIEAHYVNQKRLELNKLRVIAKKWRGEG